MCGIAFAYRPGQEPDAFSEDMERSIAAMSHRGPDGAGMICQHPWAMGHRRLAVIDIEGSQQPLSDPTGRYALTYNGELYNYRELRSHLSTDWSFRTNGDVEVVLAGLVRYGIDFLNLMEGMWALALWDRDAEELLLVRDRMGQKPLYYHTDGRQFICASTLKALIHLSWFHWQEDERSTADYLRYGYYLPGTTAYQNVCEVLPGHWLRWRAGRSFTQSSYWKLSPPGFRSSKIHARSSLKKAIVEGVNRRLVADVEVGALLSGGIDSSLLVGIVSHVLKKPLKTFTMGFNEPTYDERRFAKRIAHHFNCDHHSESLYIKDWNHLTHLVLDQVLQPFADGSLLPTAMVSRLAAEHVKVVISGDGGDELFGGYQRYMARSLLRWYTRLPNAFRSRSESLLRAFPEPMAHHSASLLKKAHLFLDVAGRMEDERSYVAPLYYNRKGLFQLIPDLWRHGHQPPGLPAMANPDDIHEMMVADALIYLPQDILTKVDRASMAHSLEARSPFLDRKVVELAFAMPRHWHRHGLQGKRMLRNCFPELLPDWIWKRRKHGFGVPVHQWFRNGLQHRLKSLLAETCHPLGLPFVEGLIDDHVSGRRDHGQRLWQLYIYLLWREKRPWRRY